MTQGDFKDFSEKLGLPKRKSPDRVWERYYSNLNSSLGYNIKIESNVSKTVLLAIYCIWSLIIFNAFFLLNIRTYSGMITLSVSLLISTLLIHLIAYGVHYLAYVIRPYIKYLSLNAEREREIEREREKKRQVLEETPAGKCLALAYQLKARLYKSKAPDYLLKKMDNLLNEIVDKAANEAMVPECSRYLKTYITELIAALELNSENEGSEVYDRAYEEIAKRADSVEKAFNELFNQKAEMSHMMNVESSLLAIDQLLAMNEGSGDLKL